VPILSRRIFIACIGSYGDVYPYIGLALALKARGHRPIIATAPFYRPAVEREAIEFSPFGPNTDPNDRELLARVMHPVDGPERVIRELVIPDLPNAFEQLDRASAGADVLVSHPLTFPIPLIAELRRTPWVATVLAPLSLFSATDLPALPPAPWAVHLRVLGPWFGRMVIGVGKRATRPWVEPIQDLRVRLGLPRGGHPLFEGQFSPFLNLALFSRVLAQPQSDWPPRTSTTGFVFYNGHGELAAEVAQFLRDGAPPVVFTLGSSAVGAAGGFYQESLDAVRQLGVRAVLLTGGFAENQPSGRLPPGVLLVDRAPHQRLFPHASVIVHQGGAGTTAQALRSGHPMLVVPHAHDQPDTAFRVTNLGVARTVFPQRYQASRVARELKRLLTEPSFQERASSVADVVKQEGGAEAAAEQIEQMLARDVATSSTL
jgi:UDP:flavonoid glycosyltransferase YjiC (YdhE family)